MIPLGHDIGAYFTARLSVTTQNVDAGSDVNGSSVDRLASGVNAALSASVMGVIGTATGSPTAETHRFILQHAVDDPASPGSPLASDWGNYLDLNGDPVQVDVANTDGATPTVARVNVSLDRAKRHLRLQYNAAGSSFTAGTTPANDVTGILILGGGDTLEHADS